MRLYIAGPMTGLPDFNYPAFFKAEEQLVEAGYEVENPARNELPEDRPADEPMWLGFMRMSLMQISRVDGLALLPGWRDSDGAKLEQHIGTELKLPVRYLEQWLGTFLPLGHEFRSEGKFRTGHGYCCSVLLARYPCGRPAADHARVGVQKVLCPECEQGKAVNCTGTCFHPDRDELVACGSVR